MRWYMGWIICICPNAGRKYRMVKLKSSPNFIQSRIHFQLQFTFILPVPWLQPPPNLLIKENWWDNHRYDLQMELALRIWSNLLLVSQKAKKNLRKNLHYYLPSTSTDLPALHPYKGQGSGGNRLLYKR